jgi:hypothetical protein
MYTRLQKGHTAVWRRLLVTLLIAAMVLGYSIPGFGVASSFAEVAAETDAGESLAESVGAPTPETTDEAALPETADEAALPETTDGAGLAGEAGGIELPEATDEAGLAGEAEDAALAGEAEVISEDTEEPLEGEAEEAEEAAEAAEEEALTFPGFSETYDFGDITVYVTAPEGAFPEGTVLSVIREALAPEALQAIDETIGEENTLVDYIAFDITFSLNEEKIQPVNGQAIDVRFELAAESSLNEAETLQVLHLENKDATVSETLDAGIGEGTITFETGSFSSFVLLGSAPTLGTVRVLTAYQPTQFGTATILPNHSVTLTHDNGTPDDTSDDVSITQTTGIAAPELGYTNFADIPYGAKVAVTGAGYTPPGSAALTAQFSFTMGKTFDYITAATHIVNLTYYNRAYTHVNVRAGGSFLFTLYDPLTGEQEYYTVGGDVLGTGLILTVDSNGSEAGGVATYNDWWERNGSADGREWQVGDYQGDHDITVGGSSLASRVATNLSNSLPMDAFRISGTLELDLADLQAIPNYASTFANLLQADGKYRITFSNYVPERNVCTSDHNEKSDGHMPYEDASGYDFLIDLSQLGEESHMVALRIAKDVAFPGGVTDEFTAYVEYLTSLGVLTEVVAGSGASAITLPYFLFDLYEKGADGEKTGAPVQEGLKVYFYPSTYTQGNLFIYALKSESQPNGLELKDYILSERETQPGAPKFWPDDIIVTPELLMNPDSMSEIKIHSVRNDYSSMLTLKKEFLKDADYPSGAEEAAFGFTVTFGEDNKDGEDQEPLDFSKIKSDNPAFTSEDGGKTWTGTLRAEETVSFSELPIGATYAITETDPGAYVPVFTGTDAPTGTVASAEEEVRVICTNVPVPLYELTLDKTVVATLSEGSAFTFIVRFENEQYAELLRDIIANAKGTISRIYDEKDVTLLVAVEWTGTLADGDKVTFSKIPYGTAYTITEDLEADEDADWYTTIEVNGTPVDPGTGSFAEDSEVAEGVFDSAENINVSYTNTGVSILVEVDKDTIQRTAVAYSSSVLAGVDDIETADYDVENVAKEDLGQYVYEVDFRSLSTVPLDRFVVTDQIESDEGGRIVVDELWTPVVYGDIADADEGWGAVDGVPFYQISWTTANGGGGTVRALANGEGEDYAVGALYLGGPVNHIDFTALGENNHVTSLTFDFGKVGVDFTSKNRRGDIDVNTQTYSVDTQSNSRDEIVVEPTGLEKFAALFTPMVAYAQDNAAVDWQNNNIEGGFTGLPATYLVHASRAMADGDSTLIRGTANAVGTLGTLPPVSDNDTVLTRNLVVQQQIVPEPAPQLSYNNGAIEIPVRRATTTVLPKTGDLMILQIPIALMAVALAGLILLIACARRRKPAVAEGASSRVKAGKRRWRKGGMLSLFFALAIAGAAFIPAPVSAATTYPAASDAQYYFSVAQGFTATQLEQMKTELLAAGVPQAVVDQIQPAGAMDKVVLIERVVPVMKEVPTNDVNNISLGDFDALASQAVIDGDANTLESDVAGTTGDVKQIRLSGTTAELQRALISGGIEFERQGGARPSLSDSYRATVNYRGLERVAGYGAFTATIGDLPTVQVITDVVNIVFSGGVVGGGGVVVIPPAAVPEAAEAAIPPAEVPLAAPDAQADATPEQALATIGDDAAPLDAGTDADAVTLPGPILWVVIAVIVIAIILIAIAAKKKRQEKSAEARV